MKRFTALFVSVFLSCIFAGSAMSGEVQFKGAEVGQWTMDIDAAFALAKQECLPILLDFTGSDWCGWCKLMQKNVFSKGEWKSWAKDRMVLVTIDFPRTATDMPAAYKGRNELLRDRFEVQGFPTYVVLSDDGETELGRLGASRDSTPESFIAELRETLRLHPSEVDRFANSLTPEKARQYRALVDRCFAAKKAMKAEKGAHTQKVEEMEAQVDALTAGIDDFQVEVRAAELGAERGAEYKRLRKELRDATTELEEWLATSPERTDENTAKFENMQKQISELKRKVGELR